MIDTNDLKAGTQTGTCTPIQVYKLTTTLLTTAKDKQFKCSSTGEWINKVSYIHTMVLHSALKKNEITIHATPWMNPENIILNEIIQTQRTNIIWFYLHKVPKIGKFTETKSRTETTKCWGEEVGGELLSNGYRASVWNDEKALKMESGNDCTTLWM